MPAFYLHDHILFLRILHLPVVPIPNFSFADLIFFFSFELFLTYEWVGKWSCLGNLSEVVWQKIRSLPMHSAETWLLFKHVSNIKHKTREITHLELHFSKLPTDNKARHCQTRCLTTKYKFCKSQCKAGCWRPRFVLLIQATYYIWTWRLVLCFPEEKQPALCWLFQRSDVETAVWGKKSHILLPCLYWDREEGPEHS